MIVNNYKYQKDKRGQNMSGRKHRDVLMELKKKNDDAKTTGSKKKDSVKSSGAYKKSTNTNTKNK
jgi:hypothetical protein